MEGKFLVKRGLIKEGGGGLFLLVDVISTPSYRLLGLIDCALCGLSVASLSLEITLIIYDEFGFEGKLITLNLL